MGQNESLPEELRTLEFFDSAQRRALFDDDELAALTLMTSSVSNVSNTSPESRVSLIDTLTNIGARSGVRLSSRPVEVHLVTRTYCTRMVRNGFKRDPGSTVFPDLLKAAVRQLRIVSGETPRPVSTPVQEASFLQRVCNTLVLCRVFLAYLLAHGGAEPGRSLLHHILCEPGPAATNMNANRREDGVVSMLILGLVEFCCTMTSSPMANASEDQANRVGGDAQYKQIATQLQSSLYDVRVEALNLLLVLLSSRLYHEDQERKGGPRSSSKHLFLNEIRAILRPEKDSSNGCTRLGADFTQALLAQIAERKVAPSGSSVQIALSETRAFPPLYSTMTSPPLPKSLSSLASNISSSHRFDSHEGDGLLTLAWSLGSGITQGVTDFVGSWIPGVESDKTKHSMSETYRPLADRSMLILCILTHDFMSEGGSDSFKHSAIRKCLNRLEDSESVGVMAGIAGRTDRPTEGTRNAFCYDVSAPPQVSFKSLYLSISVCLDDSFADDNNVAMASQDIEHIASMAASTIVPTGDAGGSRATTNADKSNIRKLLQMSAAARRRQVSCRCAILLYTLLTVSPAFRAFVFARDDLDTLMIPLLRSLHGHYLCGRSSRLDSASDRLPLRQESLPASHLYVLMVLILMISQDESFQDGAFTRSVALFKADTLNSWFALGGRDRQMKGIGDSKIVSKVAGSPGVEAAALGNVMLVVLVRSIQAEVTQFRWGECRRNVEQIEQKMTNETWEQSANFACSLVPTSSAYQCESLCAIMGNMSSRCVGLHTHAASRLVSMLSLLCRRIQWITRRTQDIALHRLPSKFGDNLDSTKHFPLLGPLILLWSEDNGKQEGVSTSSLSDSSSVRIGLVELAELFYLDSQLDTTVKFLRTVVEFLCKCLRPKMVRHNLHLLYALIYSNSHSNSSKKGNALALFKERWIEYQFEGQMWASELCSLADPLIDVVEYMKAILNNKSEASTINENADATVDRSGDLEMNNIELASDSHGGSPGGWNSVEEVMEALEEGARNYRIKREALQLDDAEEGVAGINGAGSTSAEFVYEETSDAAAFFLPYVWSLAVDMTRDIGWHDEGIVLFPSAPFFEVEDGNKAVSASETNQLRSGQQVMSPLPVEELNVDEMSPI